MTRFISAAHVRTQWRGCQAILLLASLTHVGCSSPESRPDPVPVFPVEGRLSVGKRPAVGAIVIFHPSKGGTNFTATVWQDGRFVPKQSDGAVGLPEGDYSLTVTWMENESDRLVGKYGDPARPIATVSVKPGINFVPPVELP